MALFGVVGAAALLPWLGPSAGRFWGAPYQAAAVGLAAAALGTALGAPLALAVAEVTARRRSQRTSRLPMASTGGPTIRPPEFSASPQDPFGADTLGRRRQVEEFCDSLDGMGTPVVRTVEGAWGSGKTAFGRMCVAWMAQRRLVGATVWFDAQRHGVTGVPLVDLVVAVGRDLEAAEAVAGVRTPPQVRRARRGSRKHARGRRGPPNRRQGDLRPTGATRRLPMPPAAGGDGPVGRWQH